MIDHRRASYLTERSYRGNIEDLSENQELLQYWAEVLGENKIQFLKEQYPDKIPYFFCDSQYDTEEWEKEETYQRIEHMYESRDGNRGDIWKYIEREQIIFPDFYEPFLELSCEWLKRRLQDVTEISDDILSGYLDALMEKLLSVSLRTLIFEMYVCREEGKLQGDNSHEEYEYYQKQFLGKKEYIEELKGYYPVLFRIMYETIIQSAGLYTDVIERFQKDREEISRKFYPDQPVQTLKSIQGKIADTHRGGQSVQRLILNSGETLIYKPHSVRNEIVFSKLLSWLYKECRENSVPYGMIDKGEYGWCQFVEYRSCSVKEELQRYYRKLGINLFLAYFLGTGDLHCENLIASGEEPVIVDVETLTKMPRKSSVQSVNDQIRKDLEGSVLYLGLLPFYTWDEHGNGINISAVSGTAGQVGQVKIPKIVNPKTSDMHIEYHNPILEGSCNLAMLSGEIAEPGEYAGELTEGFEKAYKAVLEKRGEFQIQIQQIRSTRSRYLLRDTQQYLMALMSSYHPDFLSDGAERELLLFSLYEGRMDGKRNSCMSVESEVEELLAGDIPYFYYEPSGTSLYGGSGREIPDYFHTSIMEYLEKRLFGLNEGDLEQQKKYIGLSMNMMPEKGKSLLNFFGRDIPEAGEEATEEELLRSAKRIGNWLLENAIYNDDGTEAGWTGVILSGFQEQEWHIQPVSRYLYGGTAGICLFFHALCQKVPEEKYQKICRVLDGMLFRYTDLVLENSKNLQTRDTGAYEGEGSIVWTYQLLYQITGEEQYAAYAEKHCSVLETLIEEDCIYDLMQGNAGAAAVLLNMWNMTGDDQYLKKAVRAGEKLKESAEEMKQGIGWPSQGAVQPLLGMSHGSSGMQAVLFRLGKETGEQGRGFTELAVKALDYEDAYYHEEKQNWEDFRAFEVMNEEGYNIGPVAWCHGAAGILRSRLESALYAPKEVQDRIKKDAENAFEKTVRYAVRDGHCLCHGCCGNLEIIREALRVKELGRPETRNRAERTCNAYSEQLGRVIEGDRKGMLPQEKEHPGLLTGMAGIGYYFLRLADSELPEILFPSIDFEKKGRVK